MSRQEDKIQRLVEIARLYYEEDRTQNEIAGLYGVSRPMVSKLLKEAKEAGIVTVQIQAPDERRREHELLLDQARRAFGINGGTVAGGQLNDQATNKAVAAAGIQYLELLGENSLGVGWGHIIGDLVSLIERDGRRVSVGQRICPLIGNGGVGLKNYHSNELVRVIAEHSQAEPEFLYSPACVLSEQELKLTQELDNYHAVYKAWEMLDVALVNIGNFPSVPDFASEARYGDLLTRQKAVGRILNYFVDEDGRVLHSDTDYAIQIPLGLLHRVKHVVGICSANTGAKALRGALRTGYINHIVAPEQVVRAALKL